MSLLICTYTDRRTLVSKENYRSFSGSTLCGFFGRLALQTCASNHDPSYLSLEEEGGSPCRGKSWVLGCLDSPKSLLNSDAMVNQFRVIWLKQTTGFQEDKIQQFEELDCSCHAELPCGNTKGPIFQRHT